MIPSSRPFSPAGGSQLSRETLGDFKMHYLSTTTLALLTTLFVAGCASHSASSGGTPHEVRANRTYVADLFSRDMVGEDISLLLDDLHKHADIGWAAYSPHGPYHAEVWVAAEDAQAALSFLESNATEKVTVGFLGWPNHPLQLTSNTRDE